MSMEEVKIEMQYQSTIWLDLLAFAMAFRWKWAIKQCLKKNLFKSTIISNGKAQVSYCGFDRDDTEIINNWMNKYC